MVHKLRMELATPNPAKGNTAFNLTTLENTAAAAGFIIAERVLLVFDPKDGWGGNHKHERRELIVAATGNPTFIYRDEAGDRVEETLGMDEDGMRTAFVVDPWEPHLLENREGTPAVIYELRDMFSTNYANLEGPESLR